MSINTILDHSGFYHRACINSYFSVCSHVSLLNFNLLDGSDSIVVILVVSTVLCAHLIH